MKKVKRFLKTTVYFARKTCNDLIKKRFKSIDWNLAKLKCPPYDHLFCVSFDEKLSNIEPT